MTPVYEKARAIAERLQAAGARHCVIVGGYVRDHLMGLTSKDLDLEVFGLDMEAIIRALRPRFRVDAVGKSFGVLKVGPHIDVSIPRRERKAGRGHRGFAVEPDPDLDFRTAAARRDFTINAISMDFDGRIIDPYDGRADLEAGILRATTPAFAEDPLRVMRGMQFAARLGFTMEPETVALCRSLYGEFDTLSRERLWEEWRKWTLGTHPRRGLNVLVETGWIGHFPELAAMMDCSQDPAWHPEGDVFTHTGHVCDAAVGVAGARGFDEAQRTVLMLAALLHDIGKPVTTERNGEGRIVSPGHAEEGVPLARAFLNGIKAPGRIVQTVLPLVAEHMTHMSISDGTRPSRRAVRRLADRLSPATIRLWAALVEADASGRPPLDPAAPATPWEAVAEELAMLESRPRPLLQGRHLLDMGMTPGPEMGRLLKAAFEAQLDGAFEDVDGALEWAKGREPESRGTGEPGK